jgi:hypothetical protein
LAGTLIENIFAFLFRPARAARENLADPAGSSFASSCLFVLHLSILLGVTFWYFVFYPEPLYYGLSAQALKKEIPAIVIADPKLSLLAMAAGLIGAIFVHTFLLGGLISFVIMKKLGARAPALSRFLALYAFSLGPLLFWVPLMALRLFFFERWLNLRPLYPFFDWTDMNVLHLALAALFIAWKALIEVRLNQAAFQTSFGRALVPVLVEIAVLIALLLLPLAFNRLLFEAMKDTLA